jgi:nicotinamidase-related amidase
MKNLSILLLATLFLIGCGSPEVETVEATEEPKIGLMIIDAQKWFIPGHEESLYEIWGYGKTDTIDQEVIPAMDSVLAWANAKALPVFVTYEARDTGAYDLPKALLEDFDSTRTRHYVKFFYGAPKHEDFNALIQASGIEQWIVIGAETDVCVYQTVKELLKQEKKVTLVNEAIYSGRNEPTVAKNNLAAFGANFISLAQLYAGENLFIDSKPQVESALTYENTVLTIFPTRDSSGFTGDTERLQYLIDYARIIGLPVEHQDSISDTKKTRLIAGDITPEKYDALKAQTAGELIVLSDCTPYLSVYDLPDHWHINTLKIAFYELMGTAAFYSDPVEELHGWQKALRLALMEGKLRYVESLQNE